MIYRIGCGGVEPDIAELAIPLIPSSFRRFARSSVGTPSLTKRYAPEPSIGRQQEEALVGKGILLWLLGIPLPIIIILLLIWH